MENEVADEGSAVQGMNGREHVEPSRLGNVKLTIERRKLTMRYSFT